MIWITEWSSRNPKTENDKIINTCKYIQSYLLRNSMQNAAYDYTEQSPNILLHSIIPNECKNS